jgi:hypothetical protein
MGVHHPVHFGDGDSAAFKGVVNNKLYGDFEYIKEECGSCPQMCGSALYSLVNKHLAKEVQGCGHLTNADVLWHGHPLQPW